MTNKQLDLCICEIATGNREALRQLYDEFKNPIFLFDLSILKNYQAAEDVEQDTFLNIMQSACKYRPGTNAKAWIFSITRNCCSDYLKTNTKYVPLEADILASFPDGGKIYTFVIDGIENNFPVPPEGFNPLTASDETLETYGFPPRPVDKEELTEWKENMAAYKTTPIPEIEQTDRVHGANIPVPNMLTTFSPVVQIILMKVRG